MADGFFPTLVSKDASVNAVANPIIVQLSDGVDTLPIDATNGIPVDVKAIGTVTVQATDLDIRDLSSATDSVAIADGGNSITVDAVDLDIRNLNLTDDAVKVSANATANSASNPIFVQVVSSGAITGEVHDYNTASAVAGGATSNHDRTAVATLLIKQISVSSSGASKVELIIDPTGTPVSKFVGFIPKQGGTLVKTFEPAIEVPTTVVTRLVRTNREGSAQDLYSTIEGIDA